MARQNLILGLQAISAVGIFALGLLTCFGQSGRDLRLEMRQGFESVRGEMRNLNTRVSRVEGHLGISPGNSSGQKPAP